ncbi:MAG TPA: hypothetical protein VKV27_08990, partial [Solirubrobacteraceae bacterium]|nr:hypothetical protein [Solirubrobacteraceae bacterium]
MATEAPPGASRTPAPPVAATRPSRAIATPGAFYLALAIVSLALGALSLLLPSTPSYDPWSWLLWAREIIHGQLTITTSGTSWKPLPMLFTIPFALAGGAAPNLWLIVARAGAIAAVAMVFRLAWRLTRRVGGLFGEPAAPAASAGPALLAGAIAAVSLALSASGAFISSNALGYSEALAAALLLVAIERLLDGHPRQAFVVGFFVALDRPEIWLFWGPLGLWLLWRDPGARVLVLASAVLVLALWFVPVKLGCGSFTCSVSRALKPRSNSLAFASNPFEAELSQAAWPTMLLRIKAVAALLVAAVAVTSWRAWRTGGPAALLRDPHRARIAAALMALGGLVWFLVIAVMTQIGFSGNNRYLVLGSALVDCCGAIGYGWAARELGVLLRRVPRAGRAREPALAWSATAGAAIVFLFGPNWIGPNLISIPRTHGALVYQANLRRGLTELVAAYGGPAKVLACGSVMTEGFQVPMVAWTLDVATPRIEAPPADAADPGPAPNVILQTRDTRSAALLPFLSS